MRLKQSVVAITAAIRHHYEVEEVKEICAAFPPYMNWEPEALYRHYLTEVGDPMSAMVSALLFPRDMVKSTTTSWTVRLTDNPLLRDDTVQVLDLEYDVYSRRPSNPWVNVGTVGHCNQAPVKFKGNLHIKL